MANKNLPLPTTAPVGLSLPALLLGVKMVVVFSRSWWGVWLPHSQHFSLLQQHFLPLLPFTYMARMHAITLVCLWHSAACFLHFVLAPLWLSLLFCLYIDDDSMDIQFYRQLFHDNEQTFYASRFAHFLPPSCL